MKLSELIMPLIEIFMEQGNIEVSVGLSDCETALLISKAIKDGGISVIEPIKIIPIE